LLPLLFESMSLRFVIIFPALLFFSTCFAQERKVVDVSRIRNSLKLDSLLFIYFDTTNSTIFREIPPDASRSVVGTNPWDQWYRINYLSFSIHNNTPANYQGVLYIGKGGGMRAALVRPDGKLIQEYKPQSYSGRSFLRKDYFSFTIPPDSTYNIVIRAEKQRVYRTSTVWVMSATFLNTFFEAYTANFFEKALLYYAAAGMLLMMLLYVSAQFLLIRTPEYGFYAAYILSMLGFVMFSIAETFEVNIITGLGNWFWYINSQWQVAAYCLYFLFLSNFLRTKQSDIVLYRHLRFAVFLLIGYAIVDAVLRGQDLYMPYSYAWIIIRSLLILFVPYIAYRVLKMEQPYARYPIIGGMIFVFFALIALIVNFSSSIKDEWPFPLNDEMLYYLVGVMMELIFFSLGLAHKRRRDAMEKVEAQQALKLAVEREQVKNLNALTEVQEQERSRFAKDLHDGLGGMLWGVKLSLSNMKGNMILTADNAQSYERSLDMLDNSILELRRVAHNLMPEALVKFGLTAALKDFCDFVNSSKVVNVIFQCVGGDRRLDMSIEVVLYRVANELVNNALRHSSASEIIIQLNFDERALTMTVEDNGSGFDKSLLEKTKGSGWPNIKSRIAYLKGTLDIETSPGNGTAVNITVQTW
jgi:signal transduction histidine kinase